MTKLKKDNIEEIKELEEKIKESEIKDLEETPSKSNTEKLSKELFVFFANPLSVIVISIGFIIGFIFATYAGAYSEIAPGYNFGKQEYIEGPLIAGIEESVMITQESSNIGGAIPMPDVSLEVNEGKELGTIQTNLGVFSIREM